MSHPPYTEPLPAHTDTLTRTELRRTLRERRRALSRQQQTQAARALASRLLGHPALFRARHVALYVPNDGEIDPGAYQVLARKRGIQFYLPVLHPLHDGRLVFSPVDEHTPLTDNRFGIPEPEFKDGLRRPPWALDAVLMPLVGFDREGGRLGMGGGFYDRTFAFGRHRPAMLPTLIGLAHDHQCVTRIPTESWDIPLHWIVTDRGRYHCRRKRHSHL